MTETAIGNKIVISYDAFNNLRKLKDDLESLLETIEIMNDETLMKGVERSRDDVKAGRVHRMKDVGEIDEIWA